MSHSNLDKEDRPGKLLSSPEQSQEGVGSETLSPPEFKVTAKGNPEQTGQVQPVARLVEQQRTAASPTSNDISTANPGVALSPPSFRITASPFGKEESPEEELAMEVEVDSESQQFDDGTVDEDSGDDTNTAPPTDGQLPPADPSGADDQKDDRSDSVEELTGDSGKAMPKEVLAQMEQTFKADFSNVSIHENSRLAQQMGLYAFAFGTDIHFAPGKYDPSSGAGLALLGHELTHVIQQRTGRAEKSIQAKGAPGTMPVNNDPAMEQEADQMGAEVMKGSDSESGQGTGIIPALMLLGERIDVDLSMVELSGSVSLGLEIVPGCLATRIDVVIEEGAFVSATLFLESNVLEGVELTVLVDATGTVSADLDMEAEILGFPTAIAAQITEDGIAGQVEVEIPEGLQIVPGLMTSGGNIFLTFGNEDPFLRGDLGIESADGLMTGSAAVAVDLNTGNWEGNGVLTSEPRLINVAPGVEIDLTEGFEFIAQFGTEQGLEIQGGAKIVTNVTLQATSGVEAGGTAEMDVSLGTDGVDINLIKVRMVATGGLNAPDIDDALQEQHITTDMDAGAILTLSFEQNSLSRIDLELTGGISNSEKRIGRLSFAGQATLNPFHFIGMLHAVTNASFTLNEGANYTLSLMPGSQIFISVDEGGVSNVDASLGLELADAESALATLTVASSLPRGEGMSLEAKLRLLRILALTTVEEHGYGVSVLPSAGLTANMVEGALQKISGSLPVQVADQEGDLLSGSVSGTISFADGESPALENGVGSATLLRQLTMEVGGGEVRVLEGANVNVTYENGEVVGLAGQVAAEYDDGNHVLSISASVDYDPSQGILRSLDASMSTEEVFSLFDGNLQVSEIQGRISIRNGELISLGGHARLDATIGNFKLQGEADLTWSSAGEETSFIGEGWMEFSWMDEGNEHRFLTGRVDASIDGPNFDLLGTIEMGLMEGLTGQATVQIDQEMDPLISASLTYSAQLMEASELWAMEFGMGIQIPLIPALVTIEAGILFGMSINTRPLMVYGTVGVENWRPSERAFPDFFATLRASWGLDIEAKVMAYLELILGIDSILNLTGGIRAGVGLSIPIELSPYISIHGGEDGVGGVMGLDLSINPILRLLVEAYMSWDVLGIWDGQKIWELVDQELADLGNINWSGSFAFGEGGEETTEAPAVETQEVSPEGAPIAAPEGLGEGSSLGFGNQENDPESEVGLTGLTDGLEVPDQQQSEEDMDQEGLGSEFAKVGQYGDGIAAVGDLISIIADGFKALMKGGPVGLIIWIIFEKPSKAEIQEKKDRVSAFRDALTGEDLIKPGSKIDLMLGILGGDYSFWIIFDQSKPFREMIARGLHEEATLAERADMLEGLIDGWTNEADETKIIEVLEYTLANEGTAGIREMVEHVGGPKRIRDQYESFMGQDSHDRADLDRIFTASYGHNWEDNPDVSDRPTYTAVEGATVKRMGRSWEQLALEAFGHESYSVYLLAHYYNIQQINDADAWQDHQNNSNNNNNNQGGGPPSPFDDDYDPFSNTNGSNGNTGPAYPSYQAYIPTMAEIVNLHENSVWQQRFQVPGTLDHAHWFENYTMIAQFAYGDPDLDEQLKAHNLSVPEILEGSTVLLPDPAELGPPWIEVEPVAIGTTNLTVWVSPDANEDPEMWMGSPDRLVAEVAQEAMENPDTATAAQELLAAATFTDETTQIEAENATSIASTLIDFILVSIGGAASAGQSWDNASPGDTIRIKPEELGQAAEAVYGHAERAAWIAVFNENQPVSSPTESKGSGLQMLTAPPAADGRQEYRLPTWSEMAALDPLPAAKRGVAPKSTIVAIDGDTWSILAQKAYGDWGKAVKLAEFEANEGVSLSAGNAIRLPEASALNMAVAASTQVAVDRVNEGGPVSATTDPVSDTVVDNREFTPGSNLVVRAGDTWSGIAVATYGDFALFVKLSNHPQNVASKTLPEGAIIYLPTLAELQDVPEFGLGLSPTGYPLLTEMLRVPTSEELHHIWVENRAAAGEEVKGVWMMASTPFMLEPESSEWVARAADDPVMQPIAQQIYDYAKEGEDTADQIEDLPDKIEKIVDAHYLEGEGESSGDVIYMVTGPEDADPRGITMKDKVTCEDIFLESGSLVEIIDDTFSGEVLIKELNNCAEGFISLSDRTNYLVMHMINLDEVTISAITERVDLSSGLFEVKSAAAERLIENSGNVGTLVPVQVADYAMGDMRIIRDENGFQSAGNEATFLPVDAGFLCTIFGDNVEVGINARIQNDGVIGETVCKIGDTILSPATIGSALSGLAIPGVELGSSFDNTTFVNGFDEGEFRMEILNIPVEIGSQFSGSLDIGLVNGEPSVTARALVQITPAASGMVELKYSNGSLSGEGSIDFAQGPFTGNLQISISEDGIQAGGEGTVSTDGFNGYAKIVYGNQEFVDSVINPQFANLGQNGTVDFGEDMINMEPGNGEKRLAGFVQGDIMITDQIKASGIGIVDHTGGVTLGVTLAAAEQIQLSEGGSETYDMDVKFPFTYGFPELANIQAYLRLFCGMSYTLAPLMLTEASATGVYNGTDHPNAPEHSLSVTGGLGINTNVEISGGLAVGVGVETALAEAFAEVGAEVGANINANVALEAGMDFKLTPDGIDPNFQASGEFEANLSLFLKGFVRANYDALGLFKDEWIHYFANLNVEAGSMHLRAFYDPNAPTALSFEGPEDGSSIINLNGLQAMMDSMWSEENGNATAGEVGTINTPPEESAGLSQQNEEKIVGVKTAYQNPQGEIHTLKYENVGGDVQVWRHSVPMEMEAYCDHLIGVHQGAGNHDEVARLKVIKATLRGEEWKEHMKNSDSEGELRNVALLEIQEIAAELSELDSIPGPVPTEKAVPSVTNPGRPTKSVIEKLHQGQGNQGQGSHAFRVDPNATFHTDAMSVAYKWLEANGLSGAWVKFHIINSNLGGKATKDNLIAASDQHNKDFLHDFETPMKDMYRAGKVLWMEADITYHSRFGSHPGMDKDTKQAFPKTFAAKGGAMTYAGGQWVRTTANTLTFSKNMELPKALGKNDKFEANSLDSYEPENLKKFGIWKSTGEMLKPVLQNGQKLTNDFSDFKKAIFGNSNYDNSNWPDFEIDDLPSKSLGILSVIRNSDCTPRTKKRRLKQLMNIIHNNNVSFA